VVATPLIISVVEPENNTEVVVVEPDASVVAIVVRLTGELILEVVEPPEPAVVKAALLDPDDALLVVGPEVEVIPPLVELTP